MTRLQTRLLKVEAQLGDNGARMYVTAAPADVDAGYALRELGIALGERDQHVHIRKLASGEQARLVACKCL